MKTKKMREKVRGGVRVMCTKNGSYCEKEKKVGGWGGGGHSRCKWRSEAFVKFKDLYSCIFNIIR